MWCTMKGWAIPLLYVGQERGGATSHRIQRKREIGKRMVGITLILEPNPEDDALGKERYGAIRAEFHNMSGFPMDLTSE